MNLKRLSHIARTGRGHRGRGMRLLVGLGLALAGGMALPACTGPSGDYPSVTDVPDPPPVPSMEQRRAIAEDVARTRDGAKN